MVFLKCLFDGMLGWVGWVVVFMFFDSVDLVVCKFFVIWYYEEYFLICIYIEMMCKFVFRLMFEGIK